MSYYTAQHISDEYDKFTMKKKNEILYQAIEIMQSYNGRSVFMCIAIAMGYENHEGENNTYYKRR